MIATIQTVKNGMPVRTEYKVSDRMEAYAVAKELRGVVIKVVNELAKTAN